MAHTPHSSNTANTKPSTTAETAEGAKPPLAGRRRPDRQRASWRWLLVLVVGAVTADVIADQRDGIARLGTLGHEVVLQAGANALQVRAQPGVVEVVAGAFLRSGMGGVLGEAVDQVELAGERGELLTPGCRRRWRVAWPRATRPTARPAKAMRMRGGWSVPSCHSPLKRMARCCGALALRRREWELRHDRISGASWRSTVQCSRIVELASTYRSLVELAKLGNRNQRKARSDGFRMTEVESEILTLEEVAAYLKAGKRTVYRLAQKGEIPAFKLGEPGAFAARSWIGGSPKASARRSRRQSERAPNQQPNHIRERTKGRIAGVPVPIIDLLLAQEGSGKDLLPAGPQTAAILRDRPFH